MNPITKLINHGRGPGFSSVMYPVYDTINAKTFYSRIIDNLFQLLDSQVVSMQADPDKVKLFIIIRYQFAIPADAEAYTEPQYKTLAEGKIIQINDLYKSRLLKLILDRLHDKQTGYHIGVDAIENIIFDFFVIHDNIVGTISSRWDDLSMDKYAEIALESFNINNTFYKLPANRLYSTWGTVFSETETSLSVSCRFDNLSVVVLIDKDTGLVRVLNGPDSICSFIDKVSPTGIDIFIREFGSGERFYINVLSESILLKIKPVKTEFISKAKPYKNRTHKFGTIDIESIITSGEHKPAIFSMYDGKISKTFMTSSDLLAYILSRKYKGFVFYAHNLSRYDFIFLFRDIAYKISDAFTVKIIRKDDKVIGIKIRSTNGNVSITIKDSFLLLPRSLSDLAINFNLPINKTPMPIYKGKLRPDFVTSDLDVAKYLSKANIQFFFDYEEWLDAISGYCENDCLVLYQVLDQFSDLIWNKFKIDVHRCPTLPSLAFKIYTTHYMPENSIPINKGSVYKFIRRGYTGGSTEAYKPDCRAKNIFCYDVNSLYPSVMASNLYPAGNMFLFDGDVSILTRVGEDRYWIGEAEVESLVDINQPYLQIHHKTATGWRTVAPLGHFNMVINSPEYSNAMARGDYSIKVTKGYLFDRQADLFSGYVHDLYSLRSEYSKSHPMNFIAKLLLNSLYGRFGMAPLLHSTIVCNFADYQDLIVRDDIVIDSHIEVDTDIYFVSYTSLENKEFDRALPSAGKGGRNVSVAIASAVTSYARVHMSQFKNNPSFTLVYTDTDSIFIDKPLPASLVNHQLGDMKLEFTFKNSVFIAPKVYAGYTLDDRYICKVKGFKGEVSFNDMQTLLNEKASVALSHVKWFRDLAGSTITMQDTDYNLMLTDSKRDVIFKDGVGIDTLPIRLPAPTPHPYNLINPLSA